MLSKKKLENIKHTNSSEYALTEWPVIDSEDEGTFVQTELYPRDYRESCSNNYKAGFDACTEILWPEIERLKLYEIAGYQVMQKELEQRVADLERKLAVAKEALKFYSKNSSRNEDFEGKRAVYALKEIEDKK